MKPTSQADLMRDSLVFQEPARSSSATDAYGEPIMTDGRKIRRQGSVAETSQREALKQGALHSMGKAIVRIRFDNETRDIDAGWTVSTRGTVWNIVSVYQARRNEMLEMVIDRGVAI